MAEAGSGGGLGEEELHRACTVEQEHTCWGCGEMCKGLLRGGTCPNVTLTAAGSAPPRIGLSLGQITFFSVAAQAPLCKNTSLFQDLVALCEVSVHSCSLSTNLSCLPHIQSHRRAQDFEGHTGTGDP